MKEGAIDLAYNSAIDNGYKGSKEDFFNLISKDENALNLSLNEAKANGFEGDVNRFKDILGINEIEVQEPSFTDGSMEQQEQPIEPLKESGIVSEDLIDNNLNNTGEPLVLSKTKEELVADKLYQESIKEYSQEDKIALKELQDKSRLPEKTIDYLSYQKDLNIDTAKKSLIAASSDLNKRSELIQQKQGDLSQFLEIVKKEESLLIKEQESNPDIVFDEIYKSKVDSIKEMYDEYNSEAEKVRKDYLLFYNKSREVNDYSKFLQKKQESIDENTREAVKDLKKTALGISGYLGMEAIGSAVNLTESFLIAGTAGFAAQAFDEGESDDSFVTPEKIKNKLSELERLGYSESQIATYKKAMSHKIKTQERNKEIKSNLVKFGMDRVESANIRTKDWALTNSLSKIDSSNPLDYLAFAINASAEVAPQLVLAKATGGLGTFITTSGSMYIDAVSRQVDAEMEKSGSTREEAFEVVMSDTKVSKAGLNTGALIVSALELSGSLSILGGATKEAKKKLVKEMLDDVVLSRIGKILKTGKEFVEGQVVEVGTELIQEGVESEATSMSIGNKFGEGLKEFTVDETLDLIAKVTIGSSGPQVIQAVASNNFSNNLIKSMANDFEAKTFAFEQIDARVLKGDITEVQADQIKGRIDKKMAHVKDLSKMISEDKLEEAMVLQDEWDSLEEQISTNQTGLKSLLKSKQKEVQTKLEELANQTDAKNVEDLRAEEQSEMLKEIPNAEDALTDGKVDREKLSTDEDKSKFDEIYDKYDKLISPLLEDIDKKENIEPSREIVDDEGNVYDMDAYDNAMEQGLIDNDLIEELESEEIRRAYEQRNAEALEEFTKLSRDGDAGLFSFLSQNLGRIRPSDFDAYGDPNSRKGDKSFSIRFLANNAMPLDVLLKELSEQYGKEITPQDAIEYILDKQGNPEKYKASKRKLEALNKASNIVMSTSGEAFNIYRNLDGSDASMKAIDDITGKVLSDEQAIIIKNYLKLKQNEKNSDSRTSESVQQSYDDSTKGRKRKEGSESSKPKKEVESEPPKTLSETDKKSIAEKVGRTRKVKAKNVSGLIDVMAGIFGLNKNQAESAAIVGDVIIGNAAKRAGISKDEMYQKIAFAKAQMKDLPQGVKFQVDAWHGSPYQFDKFTTKKMGTGEGVQAFGWGLYFTDSESIARTYAKELDNKIDRFKINGEEVSNILINDILLDIYIGDLETKDFKDLLEKLKKDKGTRGFYIGKNLSLEEYNDALSFLEKYADYEKIDNLEKYQSKNLYKVSLHKGKTPDQYTWLEWDKRLTDYQRELILSQANKENLPLEEHTYPSGAKGIIIKNKRGNTKAIATNGKQIYEWLYQDLSGDETLKSDKNVSLFLLRAGIDGVKYPAESIARGATSDNARGFNYVVFDENAVSIEEVIRFQKDALKARGAMMMAMDSQATIYALTDPNVSTPLHELAHVYEHYLTDAERNEIENWSGHKAGTVEFSEAFARGFEKFLSEGKISNPRLKSIFEKFSGWLMDIYKGIKGSEIDVNLNDKMRSLYDNMLSNTPTVYKMHKDSEKSIKDKIKKMSIRGTTRLIREKLLDRQTRIKDLISGISSKEARKSIALLVTKAGAGGYASFRFKQADKKIYNGLSKEDTVILDSIIYSRRISSINENRAKEGRDSYIGKDGYGKLEADNDLSLIELQLGVEKFLELSKRADEYFSEFDKSLKRMRDAKLISEEVYLNLKDYEYSPIKTIKYLIPEGVSSSDIDRVAITTGVTSDAIKKLSDSNDSDVIMDSRWLLMTNLSMVEGIVFENRLLNSFNDAIKSATEAEAEVIGEFVLDNPVVQKNEDGTTKRKYDLAPTPIGFKKVSFKTDGVDNYMVMRSDYANQLLDIKNKPGELAEVASKLTGTNVLRFFATAGNPLFIVGNTAVDFQNILFLSDTYSNNKLFGGFNLAFDFLKSVMGKTISTNKYKKSYEEFMVHGGSLDYLSSDGLRAIGSSLWSKYKLLDVGAKALKGYAGFMAYLGETSEIGFRIAVFEKSKSNQIKEFKKDNKRDPNKDELEDIMFEAAREARETIDFNQGGTIVKSADKFGPYLNAATQGLRKAVDYSAKNPKQFASNMTQLALMSGTMAAASLFMLLRSIGEDEDEKELIIKTLNSISDFEKANYHIVFNGKRDENGEFKYFRFKKLPQTAVVSTLAEQLVLNAALKIKGIEYDPNLEVISKSFKAGLPVSPNPKDMLQRNPLMSAFLTYHFNRDLFYDKEIFIAPRGKKIDPTAEGMFDPNVNQIYKDIAPAIGLSPIRSKAALEKIITSETTNPMIGLIYSGYDVAMREDTSMSKEIGVAMDNLINNSSKKIMRSTNSNLIKYKERAETDTQEMIIETEEYKKEQEVYNKIRESYQEGDTLSREDLRSIVEDKFDKLYWKKYLQKYSRYMENTDADRSVLDIIYEDTPEVQALMLFNRYGDGLRRDKGGNIDEEITNELKEAFKGTGRKIPGKTWVIYKEKYLDAK